MQLEGILKVVLVWFFDSTGVWSQGFALAAWTEPRL
jgi:hypothetical protein